MADNIPVSPQSIPATPQQVRHPRYGLPRRIENHDRIPLPVYADSLTTGKQNPNWCWAPIKPPTQCRRTSEQTVVAEP